MFVVGHDWGAIIAWYLCLFRPDRVTALVNTSVAFMRHVFVRAGAAADAVKATDYFNRTYGPTYYICRFQVRTYYARMHAFLPYVTIVYHFTYTPVHVRNFLVSPGSIRSDQIPVKDN